MSRTSGVNGDAAVDAVKDDKGLVVLGAEVDDVVPARVRRTEVRAALDKVVQTQHVPGDRSPVQRRLAVLRAGCQAGPARHKQLGNLQVSVVHGPVQRRGGVGISSVYLLLLSTACLHLCVYIRKRLVMWHKHRSLGASLRS